MTRRLAIVSAFVLVGQAAWLAIFWGLLHVPESSVWTLALSATLAAVLVALGGTVVAGTSAGWDLSRPAAPALGRGFALAPAALTAALLFGAIWWLTGALYDWHAGVAGQIDAWYIARTGRSNTRAIHFVVFWVTTLLRWSIGLSLSTSLLASLVTTGRSTLGHTGWLRSALAPSRWLAVTFWFVLLVAIPWHVVDWRPARLSLAAEPWFVAAKLGAIAVAMAVGWALVLRAGHGATENA